ncbi:MAG: hypothetical protein ACI4DY_04085 [Monoglobaceae bacterium]
MFTVLKKRLLMRISLVSLCLAAFFCALLWAYTFHIVNRDFSDKSELFVKQYVNSMDISLKNIKNSLNVSSTYNIYDVLENYDSCTPYEITETLGNVMLLNTNVLSVSVVAEDQICGDRHYMPDGVENPADYYAMLGERYIDKGWYIIKANNRNHLFYIELYCDAYIVVVTSPSQNMFSYAPVEENIFMKKSDIVMLDTYGNDIDILLNSKTGKKSILKCVEEGESEKRVGFRMVYYTKLENSGLKLAFALPMEYSHIQVLILAAGIIMIFALFAFAYIRILKIFTQNLTTPLEKLNKKISEFITLQKDGENNEKSIDS